MRPRTSRVFAGAAAVSFALAGGFATAAVLSSSAPAPTKTVTINVGSGQTGPTGPTGPPGPPGPTGPSGGFDCLTGYSPGILVINHPGGQTKIYTCLEGP